MPWSSKGYIRGVRRCFWMGGLTVWAAQPTYRKVWGQASPVNIFDVYSILVHSEKIALYLKLLEPTRQLQQKQCHSKCNNWGVWPFPKTWGGYSPPSPPASYASERERGWSRSVIEASVAKPRGALSLYQSCILKFNFS